MHKYISVPSVQTAKDTTGPVSSTGRRGKPSAWRASTYLAGTLARRPGAHDVAALEQLRVPLPQRLAVLAQEQGLALRRGNYIQLGFLQVCCLGS